MESGFFALALLSIFYYVYIAYYTKRFNSTFSKFWIISGVFYIILGFLVKVSPDFVDQCILICMGILWMVFFVVEVLVMCAMVSVPQEKADYIIILGTQIRGRTITGSLRRRLDKGIQYLQDNPETKCIVSGGKGKEEEISEAEAMAEYMKEHGIASVRIKKEEKSTTTCENLLFSKMFIKNIEKDKIGIVSNNFHIYRALKMARYMGYQNVFALPASSDMVLFPNYMVREFFAFFVMFHELKNIK